jgi:UDP-N-acetylmuramate dehydrogenase
MHWWKGLKARVRLNAPLEDLTTFKIGGQADFLIQPRDARDLKLLLKKAKQHKIPLLVIGAGSNILAADKKIKAAVIRLSAPFFQKITFRKDKVFVCAGLKLARVIRACQKRGLSGAEFLTGIPGTVGGALLMNAGAWGKQIADLVEKIKVMDYNGKLKELKKNRVKFGYRSSGLDKFIILGAELRLVEKDKSEIAARARDYLRQRKDTQDLSFPNAGCIFKNPAGDSAGRLLDLCGLKGRRIGGACISEKHANFILNKGNARSGDVLKLMALAKREVKHKFGIDLKPEIKIWH